MVTEMDNKQSAELLKILGRVANSLEDLQESGYQFKEAMREILYLEQTREAGDSDLSEVDTSAQDANP
jgi:hypothetical protein